MEIRSPGAVTSEEGGRVHAARKRKMHESTRIEEGEQCIEFFEEMRYNRRK